MSITIFWFRRDLRLEDNHGLYRALKENDRVLPLFIFDTNILSRLEDHDDPRITFLLDEVSAIKSILERNNSSLLVRFGDPLKIFEELLVEYPISKIYVNHDYEPYARKRDEQIKGLLNSRNAQFLSFKDHVILEKDEILKDNGEPYTVFTPYMRKWKTKLAPGDMEDFNSSAYRDHFFKCPPFKNLSITDLGFTRSDLRFPAKEIDRDILMHYDKTRDIPSIAGTSRLGLHLRFGTLSIRRLVKIAVETNETYLDELIWREFYMMILWHHPRVVNDSFKPQYDLVRWRNNVQEFEAWCAGMTGFPIVDAGMRELNATGYMHNRLRMITASFLTKLLLVDWRWGEAYFARKLLDFELASNNGGWQWSAGTGCDAAPYFRIFNPDSQTKKFDPELRYIRKWVPESGTEQYPKMLVDYRAARERALQTYKEALR